MSKIVSAGIAIVMTFFLMTSTLLAQPARAPQTNTEKEQIAQLQKESQEAYRAEQWVGFYIANMKLSQLRPYEADYIANVVRACGLLDRKTTAYHYMLKMQQQGMTYDFNATDDTLLIRDTEAYQYINDLLISAGNKAGVGASKFTLPGNPADFQAISWDPGREKFLLGTMSTGKVIAVSPGGETEVLLEASDKNGLWSINGLAVDAKQNRLWVSSAATPLFDDFSPADLGHGALIEFNLETLEQLGRYNLPVDGLRHEAGSLALADDGVVYMVDRGPPILYRKSPDGDKLEAIFASADLTSLRDIAIAPDNSRIFLSDAEKGVLVIDPVAQQAGMLSGPETMNLGGIYGIDYRSGQLYIVQGDFEPERVIRLELDSSGYAVEGVSPMAIAQAEFKQPGFSTMHGEDLYYFANSGAGDATSVVVMSTPLDAGVTVAPPDMTQFEEALRAKQKQQQQQQKD